MLSVKGIYEEGKVKLLEKIENPARSRVIVTFVEDMADAGDEERLRGFASQHGGVDFWYNDAENIYQDYLPKRKK